MDYFISIGAINYFYFITCRSFLCDEDMNEHPYSIVLAYNILYLNYPNL